MLSLDFADTAIIDIIATARIITAIVPNSGTTTPLSISIFIISCKQESNTGFLIQGNIDNAQNNSLVKLIRTENRQEIILDSTRINGNTFQLKGNVDGADIYFLAIDGVQENIPIIVEKVNEPDGFKSHEDKEVIPIGSNTSANIDIRIISATNKSIENMIQENLLKISLMNLIMDY